MCIAFASCSLALYIFPLFYGASWRNQSEMKALSTLSLELAPIVCGLSLRRRMRSACTHGREHVTMQESSSGTARKVPRRSRIEVHDIFRRREAAFGKKR